MQRGWSAKLPDKSGEMGTISLQYLLEHLRLRYARGKDRGVVEHYSLYDEDSRFSLIWLTRQQLIRELSVGVWAHLRNGHSVMSPTERK